ncbi:MAG: hypothetical protein WCL06_08230, partial [Bacteroidota bacterium]
MDKRTDAKIEALVQSIATQQAYKTEWLLMQPFVKANDRIGALKDKIVVKCVETGLKSTGVTTDKKMRLFEMVDMTLVIAASVYDYADDKNNNELKTNASVTRSGLMKGSDQEKADACDLIVGLANANITDMGTDYIIKQLDIDNLSDAVDAYRLHIPKPRQVISSGATTRVEIQMLVKEAYVVLKKLDKLMEHFKKSNFTFYDKWFRARNIILRGEHKKTEPGDEPDDTYKTEWLLMQPFVKANDRIGALKDKIVVKCVETGLKSTGVTTDKKMRLFEMVDMTLVIAASVYDYADDKNNNELKTNASVTRSGLMKGSDQEKADACDLIVGLANANITDMGTDYIIKQLDIDNLSDAVDAYRLHIPKPRQVISSGATTRVEIQMLVKEAYVVLKKLDKLMEHFKKSNFTFYDKWFRARNIILRGEHKKTEPGDDTDDTTPDTPEEDEYIKDVPHGAIVKIDFEIKSDLTYLITHMAGGKLKYWNSASADLPLSAPADAKILEIGAEEEAKGVDLIGNSAQTGPVIPRQSGPL